MHRQNEYNVATNAAIELMIKISEFKDAISNSERAIAKKVSSDNFSGFNSLNVDEIDDLINLIGYYWSDEENSTTVFVDMLLEQRYSLENKA